jgi:hypothetical protein
MDAIVQRLRAEPDGDLMLCLDDGVAYQADMTQVIEYGADYLAKCAAKSEGGIADELNAARVDFVAKHYGTGRLCDIGIGAGDFIRARPNTWGHDINPVAVKWLDEEGLLAKFLCEFGAYTFWDVLEHVPEPAQYLSQVQLQAFVFVSIPVFHDVRRVRESKHYRPGEHLYHWTAGGFVGWMIEQGFRLLEMSDFESQLGRDSIASFAFKRQRWPNK